jgi:hypothetical protein
MDKERLLLWNMMRIEGDIINELLSLDMAAYLCKKRESIKNKKYKIKKKSVTWRWKNFR